MTELVVILISTVLVNNFVLVRFLGLCPFLGVSRSLEAAVGMSLATAFVLTLSSATAFLLNRFVLQPLDVEYLRTITFILVIAASVQFTEIMVRRISPVLDQVLGIYIPLIATNCAVLGVALINLDRQHGFVESLVFGASAAAGFGLALLAFAGLRERLETADLPAAFRGAPIALVTAGLMALAFMGFGGLVAR